MIPCLQDSERHNALKLFNFIRHCGGGWRVESGEIERSCQGAACAANQLISPVLDVNIYECILGNNQTYSNGTPPR
jgi:hypothetical protein